MNNFHVIIIIIAIAIDILFLFIQCICRVIISNEIICSSNEILP